MDDIRVISDDFQDGVAGYASNDFEVLADGPIKKIEDLKGKVLATNSMGSGVDVAMRAMLRKHGLEANRDYTIVEAPFPAMKAMLAEKKVDLITGVLPFKLDPELKKIATPLFDMRDAIGVSQFVMWSARSFHRRTPRRSGRFLKTAAHVHWYPDPKLPRGRHRFATYQANRPNASAGFTKTDYRDPNLVPIRRAAEERRHDQGARFRQCELNVGRIPISV